MTLATLDGEMIQHRRYSGVRILSQTAADGNRLRYISGPTRKVHVFASDESITDWGTAQAKRSVGSNWHAYSSAIQAWR
ncbi:MAG: hypothetical protein DYG89_18690 [Caldilinea sp. CFX5]|nr:hypothetical protein [Caldilinea sp. CFX5]